MFGNSIKLKFSLMLPLGEWWQFRKKKVWFIFWIEEGVQGTETHTHALFCIPMFYYTSTGISSSLIITCNHQLLPSSACRWQSSLLETRGVFLLSPHHTGQPAWCLRGWMPILWIKKLIKNNSIYDAVITKTRQSVDMSYFCHLVSRPRQWSPSLWSQWEVNSKHAGNRPNDVEVATDKRETLQHKKIK